MHDALLIGAAFLASTVEMVEALTIVLAVGITRGWRSAILGSTLGLLSLSVIVAILGVSVVDLIPLDVLQITVGLLLLVFGMQWLRKVILRASGLKGSHDEEAIFAAELAQLRAEGRPTAYDWTGFVVSFKGVFLEGLEVAFIVITFGANSGRTDLAAAGAVCAALLVGVAGLVIHQPLTKVPENAIKHAVSVMLISFGTFWAAEGIGVEWELDAVSLLMLGGFYWLTSLVFIAYLKRPETVAVVAQERGGVMKYVTGFFAFWYDFIVGDSAWLAVGGVAVVLVGYALLETTGNLSSELLMPLLPVATIAISLPLLRKSH